DPRAHARDVVGELDRDAVAGAGVREASRLVEVDAVAGVVDLDDEPADEIVTEDAVDRPALERLERIERDGDDRLAGERDASHAEGDAGGEGGGERAFARAPRLERALELQPDRLRAREVDGGAARARVEQ